MPYEADIARSLLESEEIPSFLMDYHTIYIKWFYSLALGGIKLQVHRSDFALANEVIQNALLESKHAAEEYSEGICPRCGSKNTSPAVFGRQWAVFTWLIVGIPLIWPWIRLRCAECGNRWRDVQSIDIDTSFEKAICPKEAPYKQLNLIIALIIVATVLISIRVKTGKPWSVILRGPDWLSRYVEIAAFVILLVIFAIFFVINNGFFR